MGSGTSRGKKVAPACVSEVNVAKKTSAGDTSAKRDSRPFKPLKIHAILRSARNRAQPDCHSEGHDSDCSREDEDIDAELDTVLADYEEEEAGRVSAGKSTHKKPVIRSKTYGLCHFRQREEEDGSPERPRGSRDVNKRSNEAFTLSRKHTPVCPSQHSSSSPGVLTRGTLVDAVPTSGKQSTIGPFQSPALSTPVILYDGSEEELMDTIEREFS